MAKDKTEIHLDVSKAADIIARHGLDQNGKVQKYMTERIFEASKPYAPFDTGALSEFNVEVGNDYILYRSPYARYQWYGRVMVGRPPKVPTNKPLKYQNGSLRGAHWVTRMWRDKKDKLLADIARMAGGRAE